MTGTETTATSLSAATYFLLTHPSELQRLAREVRRALPRSSAIDDDIAALAQLPYLNAVINETLRLLPPLAFGAPRDAPAGGAVVDGHAVPGGTVVHASLWRLHRAPRRWRDARAFRPERWLPGAAGFEADERDAFHPFLEGRHACLGRHLAMLELRLVLAKLVWHFDLLADERVEGWLGRCKLYTVWARPPLMVKVRKVDGRLDSGDSAA